MLFRSNTVRKAFIRKLTYVKPQNTKTSILYGDLDDFVAEQLVMILSKLPIYDARELLLSMNPKVMYILIDSEISKFVGNNDSDRINIIRCALDYYDIVPVECALFSWIQEKAHDIFTKIVYDIKNNEYPELHSIFTENLDVRELTMKLNDTKFLNRFKSMRSEFDIEIHEVEDVIDMIDSSENKNNTNENT